MTTPVAVYVAHEQETGLELRPELTPRMDATVLARPRELAEQIIEPGPGEDGDEALTEFNTLTGRSLVREDFGDYVELSNLVLLMLPPSILIRDLTDAEILELHRRTDPETLNGDDWTLEHEYALGFWSAILSRSFLGDDFTPEGFAQHHAQKQRILEWERETGKVWGKDF